MASHRRGAVRSAVVWDVLEAALVEYAARTDDRELQVVDLGGGTGGTAVKMARLGHSVVVVDPSPDALASLERRATEAGVGASVRGVLGDAAQLRDVVAPASADVVVCHGVLEMVDDPGPALEAAAEALVPGGCLSVVAAQRSAAVFGRAVAGHLDQAKALLADTDGRWGAGDPLQRRFTRASLGALVERAGLRVTAVRGAGILSDHVSSTLVDSEPGAAEVLQALEAEVSTDADLLGVATSLHVLAVRD